MKPEDPNDDQPTTRPITRQTPRTRTGNRVRPFARLILGRSARHQLRASALLHSKIPGTGNWLVDDLED